jgi:uncharacterized protein (DUF2249 family)
MKKTITIDVRNDIRNGREPFSRIMGAATLLKDNEQLLVLAPFEPAPLFAVLEKQGFRHTAQSTSTGDWEVRFDRDSQASPSEVPPARIAQATRTGAAPSPAKVLEVDARGLEPPQPMIRILETLATLPAGAQLEARTDRRPMHLYPQLEERGFTADSQEQPDGSFITYVRRP